MHNKKPLQFLERAFQYFKVTTTFGEGFWEGCNYFNSQLDEPMA